MRLRVKTIDIGTGESLIAILNQADAQEKDLHFEDRILLRRSSKSVTAIIDISDSDTLVPPGTVGLMRETANAVGAKANDIVSIELEEKPISVQYIREKLDGKQLTPDKIDCIIRDIVNNRLSTVEKTYFVAACYQRGLSKQETVALTRSMVSNGEVLHLKKGPVADKHCVGGVPGNRTTMVVVPILAAAGVIIPKTSSRSITSPAGTADTMEVLAPVCQPIAKMKRIVEKTNGCIVWGGAFNLAAADDKLIKLRHPVSLDPEGMVLASVLAKKHAVCAKYVLIDIPCGRGTKMETPAKALRFKKLFEEIGSILGMKMTVVLTDGSQPIGNGVGPALEARDVLMVLQNDRRAPADLRTKSIKLAGAILERLGKAKKGSGEKYAASIISDGRAYRKMREIIAAQGGKTFSFEQIQIAPYSFIIRAPKSGTVAQIDNSIISKIARIAGAPLDQAAGIYLYKHVGDNVKKGEPLYTVYAHIPEKMRFARETISTGDGFIIRNKR